MLNDTTPASTEAQDEALRLADTLDGGKLIDDSTEWADTLHTALYDAFAHARQDARAGLLAEISRNTP